MIDQLNENCEQHMDVPKIKSNAVLKKNTQPTQQKQHDLLPGTNQLSPLGIESVKAQIKRDGDILRKLFDAEK